MLRLSAILAISITLLSGCHPNPMVTMPTHQIITHAIRGHIELPSPWRLNAIPADIQPFATVSLIYPPDHAEYPGDLVASGRSDANGRFDFQIPTGTTLGANSTYILEATRRLGPHGTESQSLRTLLRWSGSAWTAISTPQIVISTKTTALVQALELDTTLSSADLLNTVTVVAGATALTVPIGTHTLPVLNQVVAMVDSLLEQGRDPVAHLGFQQGTFYVKKTINPQVPWLNNRLNCPDCRLDSELLLGMDLANKDLSGHDLRGSNLVGANLSQVQAANAQLDGAYLNESNLTDANLAGANLSEAQLLGATFTNINLTGANLTRANLTGADLRTATLTNASFTEAQLNGVNLSQVLFPALNLDHAHMRGANLQAANLTGQQLTGTDLRDANLRNANLSNMTLNQIKLAGAHLGGANFQSAQLAGVSFFQAILDGATWVTGAMCEPHSRSLCKYEWGVNQSTQGNQISPKVSAAANDGSFVIAWLDNNTLPGNVMARRYDRYALPITDEIRVSSGDAPFLAKLDVGSDAHGNFTVTWMGSDGNGNGILARQYDADGEAINPAFVVNSYTSGAQSAPAIAMNQGGQFIITWVDENGTRDVVHRRFSSTGQALADQVQVNIRTTGFQQQPSVAINNSGQYVIAFTDTGGADGRTGTGVLTRAYSSTGAAASEVQVVNEYNTSTQWQSSVALNDNGRLVFTWASTGQDGSGYGVYARTGSLSSTASTGLSLGSEFRVNSYTASDQTEPKVALSEAGNYLITWYSRNQDIAAPPIAYSVHAQGYNHYHQPLGAEFQVDTYTQDSQWYPALTLAGREATFVWQSGGVDGDLDGIRAKRMEF